ncbi:MAG: 50S ribosome-binding GTPase [Phycisphaeraceae bacterium]|nr:50S ribosome-binding GTPase [Phycisphaeraceae bacterium]
MPLPRIAIVGRPNVGKSSLMNMLAHRRVSITDNTPGTTRDRVMAIIDLEGESPDQPIIKAELIDTGGFGVYTVEGRQIDNGGFDLANLTDDIEEQIARAIRTADIILFVVDAQAGITAQDRQMAQLLREGGIARKRKGGAPSKAAPGKKTAPEDDAPSTPVGDRVFVLANKVDGPKWEPHAMEAAGLGFGEPVPVSAMNNYNRRHLIEFLHEKARPVKAALDRRGREMDRPADLMLAIVGKRNAGKSTLVNTLAGEKRVIVSEIPGTTRDAVDVRFEMDGRSFVAIDTAGLRKKKSFSDRIEWFALERMAEAIRRCDVAIMMIDATEPVSQVDEHVAQMLAKSFKPCVIVVNKWDLVQGKAVRLGEGRKGKQGQKVTPEMYEEYLRKELKGLWYAPISFISADRGTNVRPTIDLAFELLDQARSRMTTGKLNRMLRTIIDKQGPASGTGQFAKILYTAQVAANPPTIVLVVNTPDLFTANYLRFLLNRLREECPFPEVPIRLIVRGRHREELLTRPRNAWPARSLSSRAKTCSPRPSAARPSRSRIAPAASAWSNCANSPTIRPNSSSVPPRPTTLATSMTPATSMTTPTTPIPSRTTRTPPTASPRHAPGARATHACPTARSSSSPRAPRTSRPNPLSHPRPRSPPRAAGPSSRGTQSPPSPPVPQRAAPRPSLLPRASPRRPTRPRRSPRVRNRSASSRTSRGRSVRSAARGTWAPSPAHARHAINVASRELPGEPRRARSAYRSSSLSTRDHSSRGASL